MHNQVSTRHLQRLASVTMTAAGAVGGAALAAATAGLAAARNTPRPLHPRGRYFNGTVTRTGSPETSGVSWIDQAGTESVIVRHSAAIGIPFGLPDIQGIAMQVGVSAAPAHLLFANTGLGPASRYLLAASTRLDGHAYSTLLPYRSPTGPLLLGLEPRSPTRLDLMWARGSGSWQTFGVLALDEPYEGPPISFDPVLLTLPDLEPYAWVSALRAPSYRVARRHRGDRCHVNHCQKSI